MSTQTRSPRFRHVMNTVRVKYLQLTSATDNANIKNIKQSRVTGTEEGLVKGKSAEEKRKPERIFSGHRVKSSVTVIQVDGELPKEQIREDAKPLEELTFTSALPFLLM